MRATLEMAGLRPLAAGELDTVADLVARAFAGSAESEAEPGMNYVLGPELHAQWQDPRRITHVRYIMRMILLEAVSSPEGHIFVAPAADGSIGAVCAFYVRTKAKETGLRATTRELGFLLHAVCTQGLPPWWKEHKGLFGASGRAESSLDMGRGHGISAARASP